MNYDSDSVKCNECENILAPTYPGYAKPRICEHRKHPEIVEDAKLLIHHYRSPLYHPQREMSNNIYFPEHSKQQQVLQEELGELLYKYQGKEEQEHHG